MDKKSDTSHSSIARRSTAVRLSVKDYHRPMVEKFGDRYLQYRSEWDRSEKGEYLPDFPIQLDLELADYCNLQCSMCPRSIDRGSNARLSFSDFKRLIDEGAENGLRAIGLSGGGEPLLNKNLLEMISYASSKGIIDIRLITNGTLLTPELSQKLVTSGLTWISISIDAMKPETYKKIRGGDLRKLENSITALLDAREKSKQLLPVVRVSYISMQVNRDETDDFVAKWSPLVDFIDIQDYLDNIGIKTSSIKVDLDDALDKWWCFMPWQRMGITAQGIATPCCTFQGRELPMGDIHQHTITEIWNSELMTKLREQLSIKNPPMTCRYCYASMHKVHEAPND